MRLNRKKRKGHEERSDKMKKRMMVLVCTVAAAVAMAAQAGANNGVIGADGSLTGYGGGLGNKASLLAHEGG